MVANLPLLCKQVLSLWHFITTEMLNQMHSTLVYQLSSYFKFYIYACRHSVIFVNENENGEKRENNEFVNENYN